MSAKDTTKKQSRLHLDPGGANHASCSGSSHSGQAELEKFVNGLWAFSKSVLWIDRDFHADEEEHLKTILQSHFFNRKPVRQTFTELVERVVLAGRYSDAVSRAVISQPARWLDITSVDGLTGTAIRFWEITAIRARVADYEKGISLLSQAVMNYIDAPSSKVLHKYRRLLIDSEQAHLLGYLYATIIHLNHLH